MRVFFFRDRRPAKSKSGCPVFFLLSSSFSRPVSRPIETHTPQSHKHGPHNAQHTTHLTMPATLRAPAPAALPSRLAAALSGADLSVPPFTPGTTNATPWYKALSADGEVKRAHMSGGDWMGGRASGRGTARRVPSSISVFFFFNRPLSLLSRPSAPISPLSTHLSTPYSSRPMAPPPSWARPPSWPPWARRPHRGRTNGSHSLPRVRGPARLSLNRWRESARPRRARRQWRWRR